MNGQIILLITLFLALKAAVLVLAWWALMPLVMDRIFLPRRQPPTPMPASLAGRLEDVVIPGADAPLRSWLVRPAGSVEGVAVVAHGWGQQAGLMGKIAAALAERGIIAVVLDLRGQGRNEPAGPYSLPLLLDDLRAVRDWVAGRPDLAALPAALVGFSFGGIGAALSLARDPRWQAGVVIGSPSGERRAIRFHLSRRRGVPARLVLALMLPFLRRRPGPGPDELDVTRLLPAARVPVLAVHGAADPLVPPSEAERTVAAAAPGLGTLRLVEGEGHTELLERDDVAAEIGAFVAEALRRPLASAGSHE